MNETQKAAVEATAATLQAMQAAMRILPIYIDRHSTTLFIPLPPALSPPIDRFDGSRCHCDWCNAHPDKPPRWNTIVVAMPSARLATRHEHTLLVHYPGLQCYEDAVKEGEKSGVRHYRKED